MMALATALAPLYGLYCTCRVRALCLKKHYLTRGGADLDKSAMDKEMSFAALLGRLIVTVSPATLTGALGGRAPWLAALWDTIFVVLLPPGATLNPCRIWPVLARCRRVFLSPT